MLKSVKYSWSYGPNEVCDNMNNITKTKHELGAGACPGGMSKPLYEGRMGSRVKINTLWGNTG